MTFETTVREEASARLRKQSQGVAGYRSDGDGFKMAHLVRLCRHLNLQFTALDNELDIALLICTECTNQQINDAHSEIVATYQRKGGKRTGYTGKRGPKPAAVRRREEEERRKARDGAEDAQADAQADATAQADAQADATAQADAQADATAQADAATMSTAERIAQILAEEEAKRKPAIDLDQVKQLIADEVAKIKQPVRTIEIKPAPDLPPIKLGVQHSQFPLLLSCCQARTDDGHHYNVFLYGPRSSGKSQGAKAAAKAMGTAWGETGAVMFPHDLLGFKDGMGQYHKTSFRHIWENGGLFCLDEYDRSAPKVQTIINNGLANGVIYFPDCAEEGVARHPDCVIIATGNTAGLGATADYSTASKMDEAVRDRFVFIEWQLDEALEEAFCADSEWLKVVRKYRRAAEKSGIRGFEVSARASKYGPGLLAQGVDTETVIALTIRKGIPDDAWAKIKANVS